MELGSPSKAVVVKDRASTMFPWMVTLPGLRTINCFEVWSDAFAFAEYETKRLGRLYGRR